MIAAVRPLRPRSPRGAGKLLERLPQPLGIPTIIVFEGSREISHLLAGHGAMIPALGVARGNRYCPIQIFNRRPKLPRHRKAPSSRGIRRADIRAAHHYGSAVIFDGDADIPFHFLAVTAAVVSRAVAGGPFDGAMVFPNSDIELLPAGLAARPRSPPDDGSPALRPGAT